MIYFAIGLLGLLGLTVIVQALKNMKIVGGNEMGIVSGRGPKGFTTISGGRVFVFPIFNRFQQIDLTPHTVEVMVDSAIAEGVVPLNVKATVSFAIATNEVGRHRAVTRILSIAEQRDSLHQMAASIIEGHLRDAIASMTPEQVMQDKDTLVARMINVCKSDLENIGLEITTMNIADVDDHRLAGVQEPDLYIALLKRIQTANAAAQARQAQANSKAAAEEEREARRADVEVRALENAYEKLVAETRLKVAGENQRKVVGIEQATRNAQATVAGLKARIEAEKQKIEMLKQRLEAEVVVPAMARKDQAVLQARGQAAAIGGKAMGELEQLERTLAIIEGAKDQGRAAYILEHLQAIVEPFAGTLDNFPVKNLSVIAGAEGKHEALSAIHPHAVDMAKNQLLAAAFASLTGDTPTAGAAAPAQEQAPTPRLPPAPPK